MIVTTGRDRGRRWSASNARMRAKCGIDLAPRQRACQLRPEILAIRERHLARAAGIGAAALRDFHDRLVGSGGLPPALAERALANG